MKKLLLALLLLPSLVFGQATGKIISNKPTGGTIIVDTINASSLLNLNQTTAGQTITLASLASGGKTIYVRNIGSTSVTLSPGGTLPTGKMATLGWTGSAWSASIITPIPAAWGTITGTLSSQTDLQTAIDAKVSDIAYNESTWNGVTTIAPSKNVARDEFENRVAKTTGNILFNFRSASAFDITNDGLGGNYSKGYLYFDNSEVDFGWNINYMYANSSGLAFKNGGGTITMPTATGTLALTSQVFAKLDTSLASGKINIGQSYGGAAAKTPSGDVTISNIGVTTIGASKVTNAMLVNNTTTVNGTSITLGGSGTVTAAAGWVNTGGFTRSLTMPSANVVYTFPGATDILAGLGTAQTFTAQQSFTNNIIPTAANTYDIGANSTTGDWRNIYARIFQPANSAAGTDVVGTNTTISAGNGTGGGIQNTLESAAILLKAPQILATGLSTQQTSTTLGQFGWNNAGSASVPINAAALWMGNTTPSASNYILRSSSDASTSILNGTSSIIIAISNSRLMSFSSGVINTGLSNSSVYRLTNGGSNVTAHFFIDPAGTVSTAGALGYGFEAANGMSFTHANGTLRIRGWSAKLTNLVNTAGSESSDITWTPQNNTDNFILGGAFKPVTGTTTVAPITLTAGTNKTSVAAGDIEFDGTDFYASPSTTRHKIARVLTGTGTLDFASTLAGTATDLTITVTGAVDGDAVSIGVPNGSTLADGTFTAWVSASNTVTIRFANNSLTLALDPASGTFKAVVLKN